jgi:DNA-binding response OmpR family regulator
VEFQPSAFSLLLVGPKVSRLGPWLGRFGYAARAVVGGQEAIEALAQAPAHLVVFELAIEDVAAADLAIELRRRGTAGALVLLEDPARSGQIVSVLLRGVDAYVATPPDENLLLGTFQRLLLSQVASTLLTSQAGAQAALAASESALQTAKAALARAQSDVQDARDRTAELELELRQFGVQRDVELRSLREQLTAAQRAQVTSFVPELDDEPHGPPTAEQTVPGGVLVAEILRREQEDPDPSDFHSMTDGAILLDPEKPDASRDKSQSAPADLEDIFLDDL